VDAASRQRAAAIERQAIVQRSLVRHVGRPEERVANLEEAAAALIKFKFARGIARGRPEWRERRADERMGRRQKKPLATLAGADHVTIGQRDFP
jgi:hypothetical protein